MADFTLPPISTLAGSSLRNYLMLIANNEIHPRYYLKVLLTLLIVLIGTPFRWIEKVKFNKKIAGFSLTEPPIFILGHWRSGTTFLHNVMCQAPQAGYLTTYNATFPHYLASKWLFESFMKLVMPATRPADNVILNTKYPQEEEFSLGNVHPYSYYHFWYFPKRYKEFYQQYVRFDNEQIKHHWQQQYKRHIIKSLIDTNGETAIFKNPVLTGRIDTLDELFPQGRFINIYRNPVIVFLSTRKFFRELFPTLWFHEISHDEIDEMILSTFIKLVNDFEEKKKQIPGDRLIEIKFEQFEQQPLKGLQDIYTKLNISGWQQAKPNFQAYIASQESYMKNRYTISRKDLNMVLERWGFAMTLWDYQVPDNLQIIEL